MSYSHVLFFGDSYMKCYVDSNGPRQLCDRIGGEAEVFVRSGGGHDYVLRRIHDAVIGKPRCLVVWGLTHVFRTEHPIKRRWLTLNYDHIKADDHENYPSDPELTRRLVDYNSLLIDNFDLYMRWTLEQIQFVSSWIASKGHKLIIFNQCSTDYSKIKDRDWPVISEIENNPSCYRIFDWYMNQHLHDKGLGIRPLDAAFFNEEFNLAMHPLEGPLLAQTVNDFILERIA